MRVDKVGQANNINKIDDEKNKVNLNVQYNFAQDNQQLNNQIMAQVVQTEKISPDVIELA